MMMEAEWSRDKYIPTMDEYMKNGCVSIALGPAVLTTLYFIGPKPSEKVLEPQKSIIYLSLWAFVGLYSMIYKPLR